MSLTRRFSALLVPPALLLSVAAVAAEGGTNPAPRFVAALGASSSVGYSATTHAGPQPANSWATGTNPKVHSIFVRLRQQNGSGERAFNAAEPGASMIVLSAQAQRIPKEADLVTIDMGTNDACDVPATARADFRSSLEMGLRTIAERAPAARIVVVSIRNQLAIWDADQEDSWSTRRANLLPACNEPQQPACPGNGDPRHEPRAGDGLRAPTPVPLRRRRGLSHSLVERRRVIRRLLPSIVVRTAEDRRRRLGKRRSHRQMTAAPRPVPVPDRCPDKVACRSRQRAQARVESAQVVWRVEQRRAGGGRCGRASPVDRWAHG